jgi:molecular chaperone GrpE
MENERESEESEGPESPESLEKALDSERKKSQELLTRLKYAQADLENYRKRVDREMKEASELLVRGLVGRLLVVQDELELAVKHAEAEKRGDKIMEGIKMVEGNLEAALESVGVKRIDCVGKPFDPSLHEAVERVQGKAQGQDMVVEEIRAGYRFRGQLLRPSMVKVELGLRVPGGEAEASE